LADSTTRIGQAAALHRQAEATLEAAAAALDGQTPAPADPLEQHRLTEELRIAARQLAPGWLGATLDAQAPGTPLGGEFPPAYVRIGNAVPLDDAGFPMIVPLLGSGHLTVNTDARDARVAGLVRCLLLRLLAASPPGSLLIRPVDGTGTDVFGPFEALIDAGLMAPPVTDRDGLRALLSETWKALRPSRTGTPRRGRRDRLQLLVIASLPANTDDETLNQLAAIAQQGPASGIHLVVTGWPPTPLNGRPAQAALAFATPVTVHDE
jgi:DNA segregation ATPase FtsK/SpoIIIE, S-DNA-T family